jgi:ABC-type nickel/cobalt efflux system permease component RcnA
VAIARASGWSRSRAIVATALCGIAHVAASVLLGRAGVIIGVGIARAEQLEQGRGSAAALLMIAFGIAYAGWGIRQAIKRRHGIAAHSHDGHVHIHCAGVRPHRHGEMDRGSTPAFWALLTLFILGPCEPLIPLLMLPASRGEWSSGILVALVFGAATVTTMVGMVVLGLAGLERIRLGSLERWSHALAGGIVAASGLCVVALGL